MKVIGLTGGIGAGKSTVSALLREQGYPVIDADAISHRITEKGSRTLQHIAETFGRDVLFADGSLDRKKLAAIVFGCVFAVRCISGAAREGSFGTMPQESTEAQVLPGQESQEAVSAKNLQELRFSYFLLFFHFRTNLFAFFCPQH